MAALGLTLAAVEVSDRGGWTLRADSGTVFEVGRDEPPGRLDERLERIVRHYPAVTAQLGTELARIDARYPQGFAVAADPRKKP
jgi:cell division protein FtsQ